MPPRFLIKYWIDMIDIDPTIISLKIYFVCSRYALGGNLTKICKEQQISRERLRQYFRKLIRVGLYGRK